MPTVPTYDNFQAAPNTLPQTRLVPPKAQQLPDLPTMPDVAGQQAQQMGRAMLQAGSALRLMALETDEAATKEYDNELAEGIREILHSPETGYLNTLGKGAVSGREAVIKALAEARQKIEEKVTTPGQRAMWTGVANRRMQSALQQIDVHASQQIKVYNEGQTVARIKGSVADGVANWTTWQQPGSPFATAKATAMQEFEQLAAMRGYGDDQKKQGRIEVLTGMHSDVLNNMVSLGQTKQAKDYLAANVKDISPDKLDNLRTLVAQAGIKDESLNLSMALKGGLQEQVKTLDTMFKDGKITAEVRDATAQRVEHNWSVRKAQQAEGEKNLMGSAYDWILKNPGQSVLDMPPAMYNGLKNTGHLASVASFQRANGKPETDDTVYYGLRQMAASEPEAFAQLDLLKSRSQLAPHDWQRLVELQSGISKGDAKAMQMERVVAGTVKSIRADIAAAGIDLTPKEGSTQAKETAKFMSELHRSLDAAQQQKGGPIPADEARRIGLGLLRDGWVQGSGLFWDTQVKRYQLTDEQRAKPFVNTRYSDIPLDLRRQIERDIPNASKEEVERAYQRALDAGRIR